MLMQNCLHLLRDKKHANKVYYGGCGNGLKVPGEDADNAYAKLFAFVEGYETRKQSVLWGMWKWIVSAKGR